MGAHETSTAVDFSQCHVQAPRRSNSSQHEEQPSFPHTARLSVKTLVRVRHGLATGKTRARGRAWCLRFGMSPSAWEGWASMHVNPFIGIAAFFCSNFMFLAHRVFVLTGIPLKRFAVTIPYIASMVGEVALDITFWRCGPKIVHNSLYLPFVLVLGLCLMPSSYFAFLGDVSMVPWQNRLKFVIVSFIGCFFSSIAQKCGKVAAQHPLEPKTKLVKTLWDSGVETMRTMDALTDLTMV